MYSTTMYSPNTFNIILNDYIMLRKLNIIVCYSIPIQQYKEKNLTISQKNIA